MARSMGKFDSYLTLLDTLDCTGHSMIVLCCSVPGYYSPRGPPLRGPGYYSPRGPPLRGGGGWGNRKRNHIDSVSALLTFFHDRSIACLKSRVAWRPSCPRLWAARAHADDRRLAGDCVVFANLHLLRVLVRVEYSDS